MPKINLETARQCVPGGSDGLKELARLMLDESPKMVEQIRRAITTPDAKLVQMGAHKLRGSAEWFAAQPVIESAARLESLGRDGRLEQADPILCELEQHLSHLRSALASIATA